MKITFAGKMYPMAIKGVLRPELEKLIAPSLVGGVLKKADQEYEKVISRCPEIGGEKNPFLSTLFLGAYAVALYKQIKGVVTIDVLEKAIVQSILHNPMIKKLVKQTDYFSSAYQQKAQMQAEWLDKQSVEGNWRYSIIEASGDAYRICYDKCGLYEMTKREDVPELAKTMCQTDMLAYGLSGFSGEAVKCMAAGDACCEVTVTK